MQIERLGDIEAIVADGNYLWRYIDIHKFLSVIFTKEIYFARMDQFDDLIEGATNQQLAKRFIHSGAGASASAAAEAANGIENSQRSQFVSSWFIGHRESLAMWELYSNKDSVAIKIKASDIIGMVEEAAPTLDANDFQSLVLGPVVYRDYTAVNDPAKLEEMKADHPCLRKDTSFAHEHEFRFVLQATSANTRIKGVFLSLPSLQDVDFTVMAHPRMEDWKRENIVGLLARQGLGNRFGMSELALRGK